MFTLACLALTLGGIDVLTTVLMLGAYLFATEKVKKISPNYGCGYVFYALLRAGVLISLASTVLFS